MQKFPSASGFQGGPHNQGKQSNVLSGPAVIEFLESLVFRQILQVFTLPFREASTVETEKPLSEAASA